MITYKFYTADAWKMIGGFPNENEIEVVESGSVGVNLLAGRATPKFYTFYPKMLLPLVEKYIPTKYIQLATAFDYDLNVHPDEVVFITTDAKEAEWANKLFGEDSIIYVEGGLSLETEEKI